MERLIQLLLAFLVSFLLLGCSDNSGISASANSEFHVVFKYMAVISMDTKEVQKRMSVVKMDLEFMSGNVARYCVTPDANTTCEDLPYVKEVDEDNDVHYTMSRRNGEVVIDFMPSCVGLEGPAVTSYNYKDRLIGVLITTENDGNYILSMIGQMN